MPESPSLFWSVPRNPRGRDFAVGDVHGCFGALERLLARVRFVEGQDRLFCVGDLIDRGPDSLRLVEWLARPGVFAVRGNHEQMMLEAPDSSVARKAWEDNGGDWAQGADAAALAACRAAIHALPLAMEIVTDQGLVGMVHADVGDIAWPQFREVVQLMDANRLAVHGRRTALNQFAQMMLWSRALSRTMDYELSGQAKNPQPVMVEGLHALLIGHTPHPQVQQSGNVWALDTGAGHAVAGAALTLMDLTTFTTWSEPTWTA